MNRYPCHDPARHRDRTLLSRYGISADQYDDMLSTQGGGCRLCGRKPQTKRLHVDHCHVTGRVRGILCTSCNTTLGKIDRIPGGLAAIADYMGH